MYSRSLFAVLPLVFLIASCSQQTPVTPPEANQIAAQIDSFIHNKMPAAFGNLFSEKAFGERIKKAAGDKLPPGFTAAIGKQIRKNNLGGEIINSLRQTGSYTLVKQYEKDKVQHLIFRLYGDDGLNYHDFELVKQGNTVYIADAFIYTTGENLSKSMADIGMSFEGSFPTRAADRKAVANIQNVKLLMAKGEYEQAKKHLEKLPGTIKKQKLFQVLKLQIYSQLGDGKYEEALNEFETLYAGEPNMYLALLDLYYTREEYDEALKAINKIDTMISKDPFLDYYRGLTYNLKKDADGARTCFERLYSFNPGFQPGTLELIVNYLAAADFDKARPLIEAYRKNPDFDQDILEENINLYPLPE